MEELQQNENKVQLASLCSIFSSKDHMEYLRSQLAIYLGTNKSDMLILICLSGPLHEL